MKQNIEVYNLLPASKGICFVIRNLFSEDDCENLLEKSDNLFKTANTHYPPSYRNNERFVCDDKFLANQLYYKIKNYIPNIIKNNSNSWKKLKINPRIRFCRYLKGQYFNRHLDGVYHESENSESKLTFMLYLNDSNSFKGGRTLFYESKDSNHIIAEYNPRMGDVIIFDHNIWHEGEKVLSGEKYILRSDVLYRKVNETSRVSSIPHKGYVWRLLNFSPEIFLSGGRDKTIKVWKKQVCIQTMKAHENSVLSLLKLDSLTFVSGARDSFIKIWKINEKEIFSCKKSIQMSAPILSLCKINKNIFLAGNSKGEIHLFQKYSLNKTIIAHSNWVWDLCALSTNLFASSSEEGSIKIWNKNLESISSYDLKNSIHCLNWIKKENILLAGDSKGNIHSFLISKNGKDIELLHSRKIHDGIIRCILFKPNGLIVSGGEDNQIYISDRENGLIKQSFSHENFVQSIIWSRKKLVSSSYDGEIKFWKI